MGEILNSKYGWFHATRTLRNPVYGVRRIETQQTPVFLWPVPEWRADGWWSLELESGANLRKVFNWDEIIAIVTREGELPKYALDQNKQNTEEKNYAVSYLSYEE